MKTRVAKLVNVGKIEIFQENIPKLKNGEILVKIKSVGICGSDIHYFTKGGLGSFKEKLPMNIGHEPSGIVYDKNGINWLNEGDRVALEPTKPCLFCKYCKKGKHNLCDNGSFMGAAGSPGAFRDYMIVHESQIIKMHNSLSFNDGALLEPLGIGFQALNQFNFKINSSVAIFGAGPIGMSILNLAKINGAEIIIMIDKLKYRLDYSHKLGATHCFLDAKDTINNIIDISNGGVDIAFDAAGKQKTVDGCFDVAGKGGIVSLVGIPTFDYLQYNPHKARLKELTIFNVRRSNQTLQECNDIFYKTNLNIVTHEFDIENIQNGFELVSNYRDNVLKAMIINN
jgi:L-iditol 2-dehydrogenase